MAGSAQPVPPPPPGRGISPIIWILVIVLGLILVASVAVVGTGLWVAHRIHQAVSVTTHRDGGNASVELHTRDGDVRLGAGRNARLPHWVPVYPGAQPIIDFSAESDKGEGGSYTLLTEDPLDKVREYYRGALQAEGMEITATDASGDSATVVGKNSRNDRTVTVTLSRESGKTAATIVFGEKR